VGAVGYGRDTYNVPTGKFDSSSTDQNKSKVGDSLWQKAFAIVAEKLEKMLFPLRTIPVQTKQ